MPRSRINLTAESTSAEWFRSGISCRELTSTKGRALQVIGQRIQRWTARKGEPAPREILTSRHQVIDARLEKLCLASADVTVVELAAGFSPRGVTFGRRFPGIRYFEGDLPTMIAEKRRRLALSPFADVPNFAAVEVDLRYGPDEPQSLERLLDLVGPVDHLVVIAEGILNYLTTDVVTDLLSRMLAARAGRVTVLFDVFPRAAASDWMIGQTKRLERVIGQAFTFPVIDEADCRKLLAEVGFATVHVDAASRCREYTGEPTSGADAVLIAQADVDGR